MVEVRLHGALAKQFGMIWAFDIASPREAFDAIEANAPGFKRAVRVLGAQGHEFRVRTRAHDYCDRDLEVTLGAASRLDIIPVITGSSAGGRFVAAIAIAAVNFLSGVNNPYVYTFAASIAFGSIVEWLTPVPKRQMMSSDSMQSWTMSGPTNDLGQNQPVPIIYGEVLTGGYPISGGLAASQLSSSGAVDPSASIGGQFDISHSVPSQSLGTVVLLFGAGPFNLNEPYTYSWAISGFANASALRVTGHGTASLRIEVDVTIPNNSRVGLSATVSLTMSGRNVGSSSLDLVSVSTSKPITVYVDNHPIYYPEPLQGY